ncbi:hypothetical protein CHS0354_033883 [Potamilus streckersoni]|uniref:Uncharacterized protein n=1 Tax=Potamilus streckersoni TaxID=2493646 RepID=A0AAE0RWX5_9BIVA|nr:hypothetical protein CHS0354_033883 [Potamilus streckersoni]
MHVSIIVLFMIILSFDCVLSSDPDGDLMFRISQTQLNELAPIMYENPREYFVHGFVDVCQNNIQTIVTRLERKRENVEYDIKNRVIYA